MTESLHALSTPFTYILSNGQLEMGYSNTKLFLINLFSYVDSAVQAIGNKRGYNLQSQAVYITKSHGTLPNSLHPLS